MIDANARRLPSRAWQRRACGIGSKGYRVYDWALVESAEPDHQYLIRRAIDDKELAFYRCYDPNQSEFGELVHVAGARWPIEECFGAGKNETGLDNYQVRTWNAWHRHIAFAILAHTSSRSPHPKPEKAAKSRPRNDLSPQNPHQDGDA